MENNNWQTTENDLRREILQVYKESRLNYIALVGLSSGILAVAFVVGALAQEAGIMWGSGLLIGLLNIMLTCTVNSSIEMTPTNTNKQ